MFQVVSSAVSVVLATVQCSGGSSSSPASECRLMGDRSGAVAASWSLGNTISLPMLLQLFQNYCGGLLD